MGLRNSEADCGRGRFVQGLGNSVVEECCADARKKRTQAQVRVEYLSRVSA